MFMVEIISPKLPSSHSGFSAARFVLTLNPKPVSEYSIALAWHALVVSAETCFGTCLALNVRVENAETRVLSSRSSFCTNPKP